MRAGVVGAGIAGRLMALELVQAGWSVTLFDQEKNMSMHNCSMAAAGLLTPVTELEKCDRVIFDLGHAALNKSWPMIIQEIGAEASFQQGGSLVLSHPDDASERQRFLQRAQDKLVDKVSYLQQAEILALEPELTKWSSAFYFPDEGCLDNQVILQRLADYLAEKAVKLELDSVVTELSPGCIVTHPHTYDFDWVFDCRGLGAKQVFPDLRGVRGEAILLYAPEVRITRPVRLLHPRYSLYIVPKKNHHYVLGASEIESEDQSEISVKTTLELLSCAYYVHSGFGEARIVKTITQARPTLVDHLPKIKYQDGLIAINGLYRHGFLVAPALVKDVMQYLHQGIASVSYSRLWESFHADRGDI